MLHKRWCFALHSYFGCTWIPVFTVCMSLSCVLNLVQSVFVLQATLSIFHVKRLSCKKQCGMLKTKRLPSLMQCACVEEVFFFFFFFRSKSLLRETKSLLWENKSLLWESFSLLRETKSLLWESFSLLWETKSLLWESISLLWLTELYFFLRWRERASIIIS